MAESQVRSIFGIHDIRFFNRSDWTSAAYYRVAGTVTVDMPAEFAKLKGGSNLFEWDSAISSFETTLSIVGRQETNDILDVNLSGDSTAYSADAAGDVIGFANVEGTSVFDAATGIATVTVVASTGAAELKEGWYYALCPSDGATVDIYAMSSSNFGRGTTESFEDDDGKVTSAALTVTTDGTTAVTNFGIELTGGSGTIAFVEGDSAKFYVQKPHGGAYETIIGQQPMTFDEYGCVISSEDNAGVIHNILLYRVKPAGMSLPFTEKDYGEFTLNVAVMYDSTENAIGLFKETTPE